MKHLNLRDMKCILLNVTLFFLAITSLLAQPAIQWDKTIGGNSVDRLNSVQQTLDGGYIVGGTSYSGVSGEKSDSARGNGDYWIVKLAADGTKQWDRTLGGTGDETFSTIRQANDGSYFVAGYSNSGISGDKTDPSNSGYSDLWILNLAADGKINWQKTIGTGNNDFMEDMEVAPDGGLAIAGTSSEIFFNESVSNHGWFVKLSATGELEWSRDYKVNFNTMLLTSITLAPGGGYLLGADTSGNEGIFGSYYLIRVSDDGTTLWTKRIRGGASNDTFTNSELRSVLATQDGGFLVGGHSRDGKGLDKSEDSFNEDFWVVKVNSNGVIEWENTIQANDRENLAGMQMTNDGGYLLFGGTRSGVDLDKKAVNSGLLNYWLVKLSNDGTVLWDKVIGGIRVNYSVDIAKDIVPTRDGGFMLGGYSNSPIGADKTEPSRGSEDYWIVKLAPEAPLPIRLANFMVRKELDIANLAWQTDSETNSDHFKVQHSTDGKAWALLALINAAGESTKSTTYHYSHTNPVAGDNYYRLKMVDTDGTFTYSKVEHLKFDQSISVSVYPNPVTKTIHLQTADWSKVKGVQVVNNQGKTLYSSGNKPSQDINARSLTPGLYFIKLTLADGTETTRKIAVGQ
ncbi:T9SS type A sorting domain-containing protein [Dyadobacter sandarakinus]|uniref:T9SS type A sorting domain-containing protein n=1 Tax=Dyadobacter sandarakinus TaxID=2747268 RepID=A0ABX7I6F5_9BACT|nr:T9SS type A sorting domain-containing protein [Dyadobacter sandarakinus]QRR01433.1 T9SS type A sorting domain-containing protein [Dyadobacter sandarakinus]